MQTSAWFQLEGDLRKCQNRGKDWAGAGLEWYNNQVRWSYYDGSWHNGPGFYSLEYTPGYIGTFYKEWAGWSEPDRYCYFGYMFTGISNGS